MTRERLVPLLVFCACVFAAIRPAEAQYWTVTPTPAPAANWLSVACSADGTRIFAIREDGNSYFCVSTNSGNSWSAEVGTHTHWGITVSCSADGGRLLINLDGNLLSTSTNLGTSWSSSVPVGQFSIALASSADGTHLLAAGLPGPAYTSTDSGATWKTNENVSSTMWRRAFSSPDGSRLLVSAYYQPGYFISVDGGNTWSNHLDFGYQPPGYVSAASSDLSTLVALNGSIYVSTNLGATWTTTSAPNTNWSIATCSADGSKIVAAIDGGPLYISTDSGGSWTPVLAPNSSWSALACSADGTQVYAAVNGSGGGNEDGLAGNIYRLTQTSVALTQSDVPTNNWNAVASSADGARLFAAGSYIPIYVSTNAGRSWTSTTAPADSWNSIFVTADGCEVAALAGGDFYTSTNSGGTWTHGQSPSSGGFSLAGSADGSKLFVAGSYDSIYRSMDFGLTWQATPAINANWRSVACSADGRKVVAAALNGLIYLSANSGTNWTPSSAPAGTWRSVCSSADGLRLAGAQTSGGVYLSADSGSTWKLANLPVEWDWFSVSCSADGAKFVVALAYPFDKAFFSTDSGETWTAPMIPKGHHGVVPVALSADGNELIAGSYGALYTWQAPPMLSIAPSGVSALVSWRAAASGFVLQQKTNAVGASWTDVGISPVVTNRHNQVTITLSAVQNFYRLQSR